MPNIRSNDAIAPLDYTGVEADPAIGQGSLAMLPDPNQAAFQRNQQQARLDQQLRGLQAPGAMAPPQTQPQGAAQMQAGALAGLHYDALVKAILADPHGFLQRLGITRGNY